MRPLPTSINKPKSDISTASLGITGFAKTGKTSLVINTKDHFVFNLDDGLDFFEHTGERYGRDDYEPLEQRVQEFSTASKAGKLPYRSIVIDTVDEMWKMCAQEICKRKHLDAITLNLRTEANSKFEKLFMLLYEIPCTKWYISHAKTEEINGLSKAVSNLPAGPRHLYEGKVDHLFYMDVAPGDNGPRHLLQTRASSFYNAGGRLSWLPATIELPDATSGFKAFAKAVIKGKTK